MSLGPDLWSEFEAPRVELLKGLRIPIPNPTPLLALAPAFREMSRIASEQILNNLNFHIESVQKLIDDFAAVKRHLEISAARVQTSLAAIAGLMPALLSDIFVLAVDEDPLGYEKSIINISSVCSSWRAIVNDRSELFTRWDLTTQRKARNAEMFETWRSRTKGRPLRITVSHYAVASLVQAIRVGSQVALGSSLDACQYLELEYRGYNENHVLSSWLSHQSLRVLDTIFIHGDASSFIDEHLNLAHSPKLERLQLGTVFVQGLSSTTVRSLVCYPWDSPPWALWADFINSCHRLQHLKLIVPEYLNVHGTAFNLPCLTALELGRSTPVADSSIWYERIKHIIEPFNAPSLRSLTLFNPRLSSPLNTALQWNHIASAFPNVTSLTIVETLSVYEDSTSLTTLTSLCGTYTAPDGKVTPTQFPLLSELRVLARVVPRNFDQMIIELLEARMKSSSFTRLVITGAAGELSFSGTLQSIQSRATRVKITCMDHSNIPSAWP